MSPNDVIEEFEDGDEDEDIVKGEQKRWDEGAGEEEEEEEEEAASEELWQSLRVPFNPDEHEAEEEDGNEEAEEDGQEEDEEEKEIIEQGEDENDDEDEEEEEEEEGEEEEYDYENENENDLYTGMSRISFGALRKAQEELAKQNSPYDKRKRVYDWVQSNSEKDHAVHKQPYDRTATKRKVRFESSSVVSNNGEEREAREPHAKRRRLQETPTATNIDTRPTSAARKKAEKSKSQAHKIEYILNPASESDDDDSPPSVMGATTQPHRTSKHAPAILPSNRAVSRHRIVVQPTGPPAPRDPRFLPLPSTSTSSQHHQKSAAAAAAARANYAFLNDYRASELSALRARLSSTPAHSPLYPTLKAELQAAESRAAAAEAVERERAVLREHKRAEREVRQHKPDKAPYWLKKGEVKKRALEKKWEGMKGPEREKAIERRRRKVAQRERRKIPSARRM